MKTKTIEEIKQELLYRQKHHDPVSAEELVDVLEEMELSEEESASFYEWCEENGLAHITHLNKDHDMPSCIRAEGSFFRDLSRVQVPGVDAIWNQIWPGTVANFPKLASSSAHLFGPLLYA